MRLISTSLVFAVVLGGSTAHAQDIGDLEGLLDEQVVSTASKSAERASSAPAQIITITSDELRAFGMHTVAEALNYLGVGMYVATTGETLLHSGVTQEVGSRGVMFADGGSRILVLLDGHTTNSQLNGRSWLGPGFGVPMEMIDHIEVVLGPGSVMYGSSAFLGVVNVVTKRAHDMPKIAATAAVSLQPPQGDDRNLTPVGNGDSLGATYRLSLSVAHEFKLFNQKSEITAQAEWIVGRSGSYRIGPQYGSFDLGLGPTGSGTTRGTVSNSINAPALMTTVRVGDWKLGLHLNSRDRSSPLNGALGAPGNSSNNRHFGLDLRNTTALTNRLTLASRLYVDATEERVTQALVLSGSLQSPEFPDGLRYVENRLSQWLGIEEQGIVDWLLDGRLVTTVGIDVRGRRSQSVVDNAFDPSTGLRSQQIRPIGFSNISALGGAYVQQVYHPLRWLGLNAGLRVDLDQLFGVHASPRAAVVVTAFKGNTIKLMYAEAFRAATPYEVEASDSDARLKPTNLKPEVLRSIELEVSQRWSSGHVTLNGFVSFFQDMISNRVPTVDEYNRAVAGGRAFAQVPRQGFQVLDNLGQMRAYGASLSIEQRIGWGLSGGLSALLSKTDMSNRDGLPQTMFFTPSWFGNAHLLWQPKPEGPSLGFVVAVLGARSPYLASYVPAAPIVQGPSADLRLTATIPIPRAKGFSARLIADYNTDGRAPIQVGGPSLAAPTNKAELIPLPRAFFMAEVRYEY